MPVRVSCFPIPVSVISLPAPGRDAALPHPRKPRGGVPPGSPPSGGQFLDARRHRRPGGTGDRPSARASPWASRPSWPAPPGWAGASCGSRPRSSHHPRRHAPAPAPGYRPRSGRPPAPHSAPAARRPRAAATPASCSFPDRRPRAGTAASCARLPLCSAPPQRAVRPAPPAASRLGPARRGSLRLPLALCPGALPSWLLIGAFVIGVDDLLAGLRRTRRTIGCLAASARLRVHRLGKLEAGLLQLVGGAGDPAHVLAGQGVLQRPQRRLHFLPLVGGNLFTNLAH